MEGDRNLFNSIYNEMAPGYPSLYAMVSPADIFSTLIAHGMILDRGTQNKPTSGSSNTALIVRTGDALMCWQSCCVGKKNCDRYEVTRTA
jgi:hypothetical protein